MTPEQIAKDTESSHQQALFAWAALNTQKYPQLQWLHHIPNGGSRGSDARSRAIAGARLRAEGVRPGIPDVFLPVAQAGYHGLYIEMKKPSEMPKRETSKGGLSDEQIEFREFCAENGYAWRVCYSWAQAVSWIEWYLGD